MSQYGCGNEVFEVFDAVNCVASMLTDVFV